MALFENQNSYLIRSANKEPDFSTVYDDLFDQYVDTDHFNFGGSPLERRSSDDLSSNAHDLLGSSNDSNPADSSPHTSWDASQAASDEFWENTLRCFQQKVAVSEQRGRTTSRSEDCRAASSSASNPDFLSLGGFPSPHLRSASDHPSQSPRRPKPYFSANDSRQNSPRKPSGVRKLSRSCSRKPSKMMSPSRYTSAGFRDIWLENSANAPHSYDLKLPIRNAPLSPPPSAKPNGRGGSSSFTTAGSVNPRCLEQQQMHFDDHQISPLLNSFQQQAYIQSPIASPLASPDLVPQNSYFALPADAYEVQPMPIPLRVPHSGSPHSQQNNNRNSWPRPAPPTASSAYDTAEYPPDSNPWGNPWGDSGGDEGSRAAARAADLDVEADVPGFSSLIPTELAGMGLMINCDPSSMHSLHDGSNAANNALVESIYGNLANMSTMSVHPSTQARPPSPPGHYYISTGAGNNISPISLPPVASSLPLTPRRQRHRRASTSSPTRSPTSTHPSHQSRSRSRHVSGHRRAKSSTHASSSTPRSSGNFGGFVNFTPSDSARLIAGVAPSGSSKTKARREKEAAEKRRRLSQAAVKAVVEAGGDPEALRREGLLV